MEIYLDIVSKSINISIEKNRNVITINFICSILILIILDLS